MISKRYAKANNAYLGSAEQREQYRRDSQSGNILSAQNAVAAYGWNPSEPSIHLLYLDANNLYGGAMHDYLPQSDYNLQQSDLPLLQSILNLPPNGARGCFVEVDLFGPRELHDYFNDYPLAPECRLFEPSPRMHMLKPHSARQPKLIPNLYDKKRHVLHYRNLQLYVELGLKVSALHKVLWFSQAPFIRPYIEFNTQRRAQASSDFE